MGKIGGFSAPAIAGGETWRKQYDIKSQDLLWEAHYSAPMNTTLVQGRKMDSLTGPYSKVETTTGYNFMGNKLTQTVLEASKTVPNTGYSTTRQQTTEYAYWAGTKYFQQKATRIQTGTSSYRATFTDYFDNLAAAGAKGQTKAVYSPAFTTFTNITASDWKYSIVPSDATTAAAKFYDSSGNPAYDSKGRVTDVWKLQTTTPSWKYVQTHTTYGGDNAPHWGQAYQVVEDYGSGSQYINRTTTTNGYTSWGTADDVTDAAGHRFVTSYDGDQKVNSVIRTDNGHNDTIVSYSYGTSGINNGQPLQVTEGPASAGLSGAIQTISYNDGSNTTTADDPNYIGGAGQVKSVSEADPNNTAGATYTYTGAGDRSTATYTSSIASSTTRWRYTDYTPLGDPASPSRVFQTLNKLNPDGSMSAEEFHYAFDGSGRLLQAAFAQTPQSGHDYSYLASSRARAHYVYDAGGRLTRLEYGWDTLATSGTSFNTAIAILRNDCAYEVNPTNGLDYNRGLKASSYFYSQLSLDHTQFNSTPDHTDAYGYDNNRDYLTSATYDGGTPVTWSYDAAGNRSDASVCDNLNRATTISGVSRTYDILGNTQTIGSTKGMTWDAINRMTQFTSGSNATNYLYRPDGMRIQKSTASNVYTTYGYDGQMPVEEFNYEFAYPSTQFIKVIRYGLGARGIDRIERVQADNTVLVGYPLYDAHGNNIATLMKSGSSYTLGDQRVYDAWGGIRVGATTGEPNPRHCANLGHLQDDESGFVYMRARYYEPGTGRFASQDPQMQGWNWFEYCGNDPVDCADQTGSWWRGLSYLALLTLGFGAFAEAFNLAFYWPPLPGKVTAISGSLTIAVGCLAGAYSLTDTGSKLSVAAAAAITIALLSYAPIIASIAKGMEYGFGDGFAQAVIIGASLESVVLLSLCICAAGEPFDDGG